MKRPRVITKCVAQNYALPDERIVEVSGDNGGFLMSLRDDGGKLYVNIYRRDKSVEVYVSKGE